MIKEKNKWVYEGGKGQKKKIGQHPENGKSVLLIKNPEENLRNYVLCVPSSMEHKKT